MDQEVDLQRHILGPQRLRLSHALMEMPALQEALARAVHLSKVGLQLYPSRVQLVMKIVTPRVVGTSSARLYDSGHSAGCVPSRLEASDE